MEICLITKSTLEIKVDPKLYSKEVIYKCFYWYGAKYSVDIKVNENELVISLFNIPELENIDSLIHKIRTDIIDFKTREIISKETKNIREMLIAKAFSHDDSFDEDPPGDVNDPLGFDPTKI